MSTIHGAGPTWQQAIATQPAKRSSTVVNTNSFLRSTGTIPASTANQPSGNFRTLCSFSHLNYDDPLVYPGQPGKAHLHMYFGNTLAEGNSTYDSLRAAGDSTCQGGPLNRSAYWAPALIDQSGQVVVPDLATVYYKGVVGSANDISGTRPMPFGLKMVAGYDMQATGQQVTNFSWWCDAPNAVHTQTTQNCSTTLQVRLAFPPCWDGRNLDSADHRSHMAYPVWVNGRGQCPGSHPVQVPEYTIGFQYSNAQSAAGWRLSSDTMPGMTHANGSTFHSDWIGAWDPQIQETYTRNCIAGLRDCVDGELGDGRALTAMAPYNGPKRIPQPTR